MFVFSGHSQEKNDIWRLRKELFEKRQYDKNVRPTNHEHGPTEIMLQFTFVRIKVVRQTFSFLISFD